MSLFLKLKILNSCSSGLTWLWSADRLYLSHMVVVWCIIMPNIGAEWEQPGFPSTFSQQCPVVQDCGVVVLRYCWGSWSTERWLGQNSTAEWRGSLFTSLIDSYPTLYQATPKSFFMIREDINKIQLIFVVIGVLHEGIEMRVFDVCPELRTLNVHKSQQT